MRIDIAKLRKEILPVIFLFITSLTIHFYFLIEKTLFTTRGGDSKGQYIFFYYFLHRLFSEGHFFWSWNYGLGGDIFGQYTYYYATSLFFWLTMPFKVDSIRDVLALKLFLSILKSFSAMTLVYILHRYNQRRRTSALIGALIYGGSIIIAKFSLRDDFMVDPMVWLPLMVLGYDRLVDKNKKWLFVFSIFLIAVSNFYFAFVATVYLYMYGIYKYFLVSRSYTLRDFIKYYLKLIYYYLMGLLIASFSFLPAVYTFLNTDRYSRKFNIPILFDSGFYKGIIFNLFYNIGYNDMFAITIPISALFLLVYGFSIRERNIRIKMLFTSFIFLLYLIPITYSFFNGFNAIQNRWLYLFTFTLGLVIPYIVDWLIDKGYPNSRPFALCIFSVLFLIVKFKSHLIGMKVTKLDLVILGIAFITFILLVLRNKYINRIIPYGLLGLMLVNILAVDYGFFNKHLGSYHKQAAKDNRIFTGSGFDNTKEKEVINYIKGIDKGFYRIMWNDIKHYNTPMLYGYNGFSTYQSLIPYNIHRFNKEHYNIIQPMDSPSRFKNLDNRLYIENVLTNKYYVVKKGSNFVPYGFTEIKTINNFIIYKNNNFLPIGLMYYAYLDKNDFEKLNFPQRDQLLLNALVVNNPIDNLQRFDIRSLRVKTLHDGLNNVTFKNIIVSGNHIKADKKAGIIIPIQKQREPGETFVQINMKSTVGLPFDLIVNGKRITKRAPDYPYSLPQEEFVFNLGHQDIPNNKIKIRFSPGEYKVGEIKVLFNSYKDLDKLTKEKRKNALNNISYTEESIKGDIYTDKKGLLYMAIPYSKGWHVKVDGKNTEYNEVNHSFIGIPLDKGKHKVELYFITPYFIEGVIVSIIALISLIVINSFIRYRRKSTKKDLNE